MVNYVFITDQEGRLLWEGKSSAAFLGLQAGESFWFGSLQDRVWASIMSISYGLDTASGDFHVELVVQKANPTPTKTALKKWKVIDHGEKTIKQDAGGMISIDDGRIVVILGNVSNSVVGQLALQINTPHGPIIKTENKVNVGSSVRFEGAEQLVIATLTYAERFYGGRVRITEHVAKA